MQTQERYRESFRQKPMTLNQMVTTIFKRKIITNISGATQILFQINPTDEHGIKTLFRLIHMFKMTINSMIRYPLLCSLLTLQAGKILCKEIFR